MSKATALRRLRPAAALLLASGLFAALFAVCCCLVGEQSHVDASPVAGVARTASAHEIATDGPTDGHVEQDCDRLADTAVAVSVTLHGATVLSATVAGAHAQPAPGGVAPARVATPPPPAARLLCVMRT